MKKALMTLMYLVLAGMLYATEKPQQLVEQQAITVQSAAGFTASSEKPLAIQASAIPFKVGRLARICGFLSVFILAIAIIFWFIPILKFFAFTSFFMSFILGAFAWWQQEDSTTKRFGRIGTFCGLGGLTIVFFFFIQQLLKS